MNKLADTSVPILAEIAARWSPRAFDPARAVEADKLRAVLEAARWAPSCFGDQPWRFVICDKASDDGAWAALFSTLAEGNQRWCQRVPVLILAVADTLFTFNEQPNRWAGFDVGAAWENLAIEAVHQGLAAHAMGGFDVRRVREVLAIPERYQPMIVIALGYPGDPAMLEGWQKEAESAPRARRPLSELCFAGRFGQPWGLR